MKNKDHFKNKLVIVAGLARSGLACANLLFSLGAKVGVTDSIDNESTRNNAKKLKSKDIKLELGKHSEDFIKGNDLLVLSPGVPNDSGAVLIASKHKIPVISEIELASDLCPATIIAVTGSSGKTTVTTLIGKVLQASGRKAFVCGNIGNPFAGEVEKMREGDFVSLEVSSFQLETIKGFKPKISVILNFSPNHLDRYKSLEDYYRAKKRIFLNQDKEDYLVINRQDPLSTGMAGEVKAQIAYFTQTNSLNPNHAAVLAVAAILGIDEKIALSVFREFKGLPHRMESIAEINNISFINDSKATTADSTLWALRNIDRPIILIAGGKDKGVDYTAISALAKEKVKKIILIGEAKKKISGALNGVVPTEEAGSLEDAVNKAFGIAKKGDCVLLSPMCSSFDMFANYEERGVSFKKAVLGLAKERCLDGKKS